ncbi:38350_t:CDS:1, partial [Gigaspora margarita]
NLTGLETSSNFNNDFETNDDESEQESDNYYDVGEEAFKIVNSDEKITAINLRIDYICRGENLKSMCLYDYATMIHKIKISSKEIDKLARQKSREGRATRVD